MLFPLLLFASLTFARPPFPASTNQTTDCSNFRNVPSSVNASYTKSNDWTSPPPSGASDGHWYLHSASNPLIVQLVNLQYDVYPLLPTSANTPQQQIDLISYNKPNSSAIYTMYGIDTLLPNSTFAWAYNVSGGVKDQSRFGWLSFGYDETGNGYFVDYQSASNNISDPTLSVWVRNLTTFANTTLYTIETCLNNFADPGLTALVSNLTAGAVDPSIAIDGPVVCDSACQNNTGAPTELAYRR